MTEFTYNALIRTFNSEKTLGRTLASLEEQTRVPSGYIFVDSGSTDRTLAALPQNSTVHKYTGHAFNYSASINQGLDYVDADYVLVISSHTALLNPGAMNFAINLLAKNDSIGAAYFILDGVDALTYEPITSQNFTGFNGIFNTCGVYRASFLQQRRFREDVLSAEDQEWSKWLLDKGKTIARISGGNLRYSNPKGYFFKKRLDEHTAVAMHVKPELRRLPHILRVAYRVVRIYPWQRWSERMFNLWFLAFLLRNIDRKQLRDQ